MKFQHVLTFVTALAALVSFPAIVIILLQVVEPTPVTDGDGPARVITNPAYIGQYLTYLVQRCSDDPFIQYPFQYSRSTEMVEEFGPRSRVQMPSGSSLIASPGCEEVYITLGPIPPQVVPGTYHIEGAIISIGRFRISPSTTLFRTESFEVIQGVPTG